MQAYQAGGFLHKYVFYADWPAHTPHQCTALVRAGSIRCRDWPTPHQVQKCTTPLTWGKAESGGISAMTLLVSACHARTPLPAVPTSMTLSARTSQASTVAGPPHWTCASRWGSACGWVGHSATAPRGGTGRSQHVAEDAMGCELADALGRLPSPPHPTPAPGRVRCLLQRKPRFSLPLHLTKIFYKLHTGTHPCCHSQARPEAH